MNKSKNIVWIITVIALLGLSVVLYKTISNKSEPVQNEQISDNNDSDEYNEFSDGLNNPDSVVTYKLKDFEDGISEKSIYDIDINKDGKPDRITKSFFNNWNAHSYYKYTIEINDNGKYVDITPDGLRTINGADCDLQQIQFKFKPKFQITVISRKMGDTWNESTTAYKKIYSLDKNNLTESKEKELRSVCDVKELF
jgi:hypothetical protein